MVSVANVHDSKAAVLLIKTLEYLLIPLQLIIADGGYRGNMIEETKANFNYVIDVVMRSDSSKKNLSPYRRDRSLNALTPDSIMTEDFAETMSRSWNLLR